VGFDNGTAAKKKLEEIANCFPNDKAVGEIWYRNFYFDRAAYYEITYEDRRACVNYIKSKKVFKNSK